MKVQFTDAATQEVLWSNDSLTFRDEYELQTAEHPATSRGERSSTRSAARSIASPPTSPAPS